MFFDQNEIKLEIIIRKVSGKSQYLETKQSMQQRKYKIQIKKYFELNANENTVFGEGRYKIRGKFIALIFPY